MWAHVQDGILKVAFFLPDRMRDGIRKPDYELYVDRGSKQFLTFNTLESKWQSAMLCSLEWPRYVYTSKNKWINKADRKVILEYLGDKENGAYHALQHFQDKIREEALKQRHKKETDPWDRDLEQVPPLPKDWDRWVDKVAIPDNYIFYQYSKKGVTSGYCSFCEQDVPVSKPRYNAKGHCPRCRHEVTFKSTGKAGTIMTERAFWYLMQKCRDGFIIREFYGDRVYRKGEYKKPEVSSNEIRRVIYTDVSKAPRAYYQGLYKLIETRWIKGYPCSGSYVRYQQGRVYGKTLPTLAKSLERTGLLEALSHFKVIDPEQFLAIRREHPMFERLMKAGLYGFVNGHLSGGSGFYKYADKHHPKLTKAIGVNKQELKRLRENNGEFDFLEWMRYEKQSGTKLDDAVIRWYCQQRLHLIEIKPVMDERNANP